MNVLETARQSHHEDLIEFAMWLTGHDRETIEQMYSDWSRDY
jgi:hypothetical protein